MRLEKDANGWTARARPTGRWRPVSAGLLGVWLVGWTLAELFGLFALGVMVHDLVLPVPLVGVARGHPLSSVLTLLVTVAWALLWTAAGVSSWRAFLWIVSSEERLAFNREGLTRWWRLGPWRSERQVGRDELVDLEPEGPSGALVASLTSGEQVELVRNASVEERRALADRLRELFRLAADPGDIANITPAGWELAGGPEGAAVLRPSRRARSRATWGWGSAALYLGVGAVLLAWRLLADGGDRTGTLIAWGLGTLAVLAGVKASRGRHGREQWWVQQGALVRITHGLFHTGHTRYALPKLSVERTVDSDGAVDFTLWVRAANEHRRVQTASGSPRASLHLGLWLARRLGVTLQLVPPDLGPEGMPAKR
ncbi:hypothetical protein [Pyxidicoccus caerfyrddinensis]|uniref:hypothetical protein n=1 Tax=Pyxidicoccus caerfyrddinensis TaxID=2709663 RepID=UPI0013DB49B6|nr:hypothetical protein [Pyxidicoccus caerfyrddinensis]